MYTIRNIDFCGLIIYKEQYKTKREAIQQIKDFWEHIDKHRRIIINDNKIQIPFDGYPISKKYKEQMELTKNNEIIESYNESPFVTGPPKIRYHIFIDDESEQKTKKLWKEKQETEKSKRIKDLENIKPTYKLFNIKTIEYIVNEPKFGLSYNTVNIPYNATNIKELIRKHYKTQRPRNKNPNILEWTKIETLLNPTISEIE